MMHSFPSRTLLLVALALCPLFCARAQNSNEGATSVHAVIMAPLHRSVARRQSLSVDVDILMDGEFADVYGVLYLDGQVVAYLDAFPIRSIIGNVSDGVHTVTFAAVGAQNQVLHEVSHEVQVAVNWAASLWRETEVFIWSPVDGDYFTLHPDDKVHDVPVRISLHSPSPNQLIEVFLNGDIVLSAVAGNVSFTAPAVAVGSHVLSVVCGDATATSVFSVQPHQLPVFIPQPPHAPATGFASLPPQTVFQVGGGPSIGSISICILAFPGSNKLPALQHTLRTLQASGLIPSSELLVFVQELDDDLIDVARGYNAHILGFSRAIGKGNAWRHLALAASRPLVLLLEEDFSVVTSPELTHEVSEYLHPLTPQRFVCNRLFAFSLFQPSSRFSLPAQRLLAACTLLLGNAAHGIDHFLISQSIGLHALHFIRDVPPPRRPPAQPPSSWAAPVERKVPCTRHPTIPMLMFFSPGVSSATAWFHPATCCILFTTYPCRS
jgi:hypothetical protein